MNYEPKSGRFSRFTFRIGRMVGQITATSSPQSLRSLLAELLGLSVEEVEINERAPIYNAPNISIEQVPVTIRGQRWWVIVTEEWE